MTKGVSTGHMDVLGDDTDLEPAPQGRRGRAPRERKSRSRRD
jgi:hypothetical protein